MKKKYEPFNSVDKKKSKKDWNARILVLDDWTYNDSEFHMSSSARRVHKLRHEGNYARAGLRVTRA